MYEQGRHVYSIIEFVQYETDHHEQFKFQVCNKKREIKCKNYTLTNIQLYQRLISPAFRPPPMDSMYSIRLIMMTPGSTEILFEFSPPDEVWTTSPPGLIMSLNF